MKLHIDTSNPEQITIHIDDQAITAGSRKKRAQYLLALIDKTLKKEGRSLKDISTIEVNTGPGSFTGIRVGVSIANALGWALDVPVNGRNIKKEGPIIPNYR